MQVCQWYCDVSRLPRIPVKALVHVGQHCLTFNTSQGLDTRVAKLSYLQYKSMPWHTCGNTVLPSIPVKASVHVWQHCLTFNTSQGLGTRVATLFVVVVTLVGFQSSTPCPFVSEFTACNMKIQQLFPCKPCKPCISADRFEVEQR